MFAITSQPIDTASLRRQLESPQAGALVVFEGLVRNHNEGRAVAALEYECCESLALNEAEHIFQEAGSRFTCLRLICVHRVGLLRVGETAVWAGVSSAHRDPAFEACRYLIDEIKLRLPIWKKEHYLNGASDWVNCRQCAGAHPVPAPGGG